MSLSKRLKEPKPMERPTNYTLGSTPKVVLDRWDASLRPQNADDASTITMLDVIGEGMFVEGVTPKRIRAALRSIGQKPVTVLLNSPGGDFFDGLAIFNLLREHPAEVTVKILGIAASAAAIIAMAGDRIEIPKAGFLMIHNTRVGDENDRHEKGRIVEAMAEFDGVMASLFSDRTGLPRDEIAGMLDAQKFIGGEEALELGFADALLSESETKRAEPDAAAMAARRMEAALRADTYSRTEARALLRDLRRLPAEAGSRDDRRAAAGDLAEGAAGLLRALRSN